MGIHKTLNKYIIKRRLALFLSFLISGGLLIFPPIPILIGMIIVCLNVLQWRIQISRNRWQLLLVFLVLLITIIRPGEISYISLASRLLHFVGAILLLEVYRRAPKGALALDLYTMLRWMAVQALITVFLAYGAESLFSTVVMAEINYKSILYIFNYHNMFESIPTFVRPDGLFFEPAVFQIYLSIFLYLSVFVFKDLKNSVLALLAALTTQSTTGLLIIAILGCGAFYLYWNMMSGLRRAIIFSASFIIIPALLFIGQENLTHKLYGEARGSTWSREYDLYTGINVIKEYPLMGIGFDPRKYFEVSARVAYTDTDLILDQTENRPTSNGLVQLFYVLGVPLGLIFFIGIFRQSLLPHRWLFGALLTLSFFSETVLFAPFFMSIILSAFSPLQRDSIQLHRVTGVANHDV